jgi:hypothetical protein
LFDPCHRPQPADVFTFESYKRFLTEALASYGKPGGFERDLKTLASYRARLPICLLARCPVCGREIVEPVDVFSLNGFGWGDANNGLGWSHSMGVRAKEFDYCAHVKIISYFLNLNGLAPDDLMPGKSIAAGPEIPSVMRVPMRSEKTKIVMHRLPLGRFDDADWQPRYSLYFLSYFTDDAQAFAAATADWGLHYGMAEYDDVDYDLAAWANRKRLLWLKPDDSTRPLANIEQAPFPYAPINGDRRPFRTLTRDGVVVPKPGLVSRLLNWMGGHKP